MRSKVCIAAVSLCLAFAAQAGEAGTISDNSSSVSDMSTFSATVENDLPPGVDILGNGLSLSPSGFVAEKIDAVGRFLKPFVAQMLPAGQEEPVSD